jgi:GH24 family phage-related lysozyme (muramidase)
VPRNLASGIPFLRARQGVLIDMAYNLGFNGLLQFKNMLKKVEQGDYAGAAQSILASKAAKQHASWGNPRYERLAAKMKG